MMMTMLEISKSLMKTNVEPQTTSFGLTGQKLLILLGLTLFLGAFLAPRAGYLSRSLFFPLLVAALISALAGYGIVPLLGRLKAGQVIREDGPSTHLQKAGTPTMGGVFLIPVALGTALVWSKFDTQVLAVSALTFAYFIIGGIDDWQILVKKSNKGISPRTKLILQILGAVGFCLWSWLTQSPTLTSINLPFGLVISLGLVFWAIAGFVIVAESNATNLTDGVDGLAGGTCAMAALALGIVCVPTYPNLAIFCACLSGACLGFVVHNRHRATVFMGDTGSLALGSALAAVGILSGNLWALFVVSGVFFAESLSVIAQVSYYKATKGPDGVGKRLLKMAPLHHHLELSGWSETQVVGVFYLLNALLGLLVVLTVWPNP
jgi:phospho-N-acetylmuramoyl-pentapeptide-transferase